MELPPPVSLGRVVLPGETIDVTVTFRAPNNPGSCFALLTIFANGGQTNQNIPLKLEFVRP